MICTYTIAVYTHRSRENLRYTSTTKYNRSSPNTVDRTRLLKTAFRSIHTPRQQIVYNMHSTLVWQILFHQFSNLVHRLSLYIHICTVYTLPPFAPFRPAYPHPSCRPLFHPWRLSCFARITTANFVDSEVRKAPDIPRLSGMWSIWSTCAFYLWENSNPNQNQNHRWLYYLCICTN